MLGIMAFLDQKACGSGMCKAGIAGFHACSLVHRPLMSDIMAVMDQKDNYDISFAVQRQSPWSRQFVRPWISQVHYMMADVSVVQVLFPFVAQRQSSWSKLFV